ASNDSFAKITPEDFLLNTALSAMPQAAYLPPGILQQWRIAAGAEKDRLDRQYGIQKRLDEITYHIRESVFLKYLTKELAGFLGCDPKFETVIEARNERGKDYHRYMSDLFRDVKLINVMVDTGCCGGMDAKAFNGFADAIRPCTMRAIARVETIQ